MDTMSDVISEREDDSGIESSNADSGDNSIYIRISIPEHKIQKCLQFHPEDTIWMAKQRIITMLSRDLRDPMNYGLYCPPMNGRAGKFLDEERFLKEYPLPGPIGFLEFKYKRRVYKLMQLNPRKLKQIHARSNLKIFMESIRKYDLDKINKMTLRGLDPNFHEHETGDSPLCVAAQSDKARPMILTLIGGGAHIDFRTRKTGLTPLHRASQKGNYDAIKTFLDLGSSPNYKDSHGLTPLYHAVCHDTSPRCVELLLHDHATVGITDEAGSTEVHQACKYGRVQHLEHLLFYGADMNVQNASGNTPLHVCAVNNQESCARVLLFRGVDKGIQNFANQNAFQVAVIAGNCELADIIKHFRHEDIVPFQELPQYNDKRRMTVTVATLHKLQRSRSDPRLNLAADDSHSKLPSSPNPSSNSMPQFLANGTLFDPAGAGLYQNVKRDYAQSEASLSVSSGGSYTGTKVDASDFVMVNRSTLAGLTKADGENTPRTVVLQKGKNGFGFVLRGAKSQNMDTSTLEFKPTADFPALQYLDRVDRESMADRAGLKAGDFLLEINNESVVNATHERTVQLIKQSGDTLAMKVVTVKPLDPNSLDQRDIHADGTRTLPFKKKVAPQPPSRNPKTSLTSAARAEAVSTLESFNVLDRLDQTLSLYESEPDRQSLGNASDSYLLNKMATSRGVDPNNKTASISRRTKRMSSVPLDGIMERQGNHSETSFNASASNQSKPVVPGLPRRISSPEGYPNGGVGHQGAYTQHITRVEVDDPEHRQPVNHSQGHYAEVAPSNVANIRLSAVAHNDNVSYKGRHEAEERIYAVPHGHRTQEDTTGAFSVKITDNKAASIIPPHPNQAPPVPPSHSKRQTIPPPPRNPPPNTPHSGNVGEVVQITTQQTNQYANVSEHIQRQRSGTGTDSDGSYESSFRPGTNARMTKEPLGLPPPVGHSRTSSGTSSLSSSASGQGEYSVSRLGASPAQDGLPRSSVAVTADVHTRSDNDNTKAFYEPEPDYDRDESKPKMPQGDIPSLRAVRESWANKDSPSNSGSSSTPTSYYRRQISEEKSPAPKAAVTVALTATASHTKKPAPSPPPKQEQPAMSQFGDAIKMAAEAREKRIQESPPRIAVKTPEHQKAQAAPTPPPPPPPPPQAQTSAAIPPPPADIVPAPPAPPPPPPPPVPSSEATTPIIVKKPLPPHIQKQLDEQKKREDSHSALLAAVAKRRNIVESADMDNLADNIESRVNRGKKLQTIVYKSDQTKAEVKTPTSPAAALLAKAPFDPVQHKESKEKTPERQPAATKSTDQTDNNNVPKATNQNGSVATPPPPTTSSSNNDFLASAEKARQDYLQKKAQMTLEKKSTGQSAGTRESPANTKPQAPAAPASKAPLGDLAQLIAQKAVQRQKSTDGVLENHNNNNASGSSPHADWADGGVRLQGATLDYSQTETPRSSRAPSFSKINSEQQSPQLSVFARKRMFEASNKTVNGGQTPQLVIPPPQDFKSLHGANSKNSNVSSSKLGFSDNASKGKVNGHDNPRLVNGTGHTNGLAQTLVVRDYRAGDYRTGDYRAGQAVDTQLEFIPPPPLFDNDDASSMVSTGSTLSTLSSADHDSCIHDSPSHSSSSFVPPPPLFDDSPNFSSTTEFIPPPTEFDTVVSPGGSTLRNVQKQTHSNSFSYPAVRSTGTQGSHSYHDKPIETWAIADVTQWLESLQLAEHKGRFSKSNINGQMLVQMGRSELIALGVQQVGQRMTIERNIKKAMIQQSRH